MLGSARFARRVGAVGGGGTAPHSMHARWWGARGNRADTAPPVSFGLQRARAVARQPLAPTGVPPPAARRSRGSRAQIRAMAGARSFLVRGRARPQGCGAAPPQLPPAAAPPAEPPGAYPWGDELLDLWAEGGRRCWLRQLSTSWAPLLPCAGRGGRRVLPGCSGSAARPLQRQLLAQRQCGCCQPDSQAQLAHWVSAVAAPFYCAAGATMCVLRLCCAECRIPPPPSFPCAVV